jgi:hypothetical protein
MNLIYINNIGTDYKGQEQYEFIFSDRGDFEMDSWYTIPASLSVETLVPDEEYISVVGLLKNTDLKLELIQDSDVFGVIDAAHGVISLGWEVLDLEKDDDEPRLTFKFGEPITKVVNKLKIRNYTLSGEYIKETE